MPLKAAADSVSGRFCADDADVIFRSCDGSLFKIHRKNLETSSEGFSPPSDTNSSQNEIVSLTESAETLDLLFQFMYPQRQPDLTKIDFKQLAELAEAAEKYQVFAAMSVCNIYMTEAYSEHSFDVMLYAMRHGYGKLMDKAEIKSLEVSPTWALKSCTPQVYIAWTQYHAQWVGLLERFRKHCASELQGHGHSADQIAHLLCFVAHLDKPSLLLNHKTLYRDFPVKTFKVGAGTGYNANTSQCPTCKANLQRWSDEEMEQAIQQMKKLGSFL